MNYFSFRTVKLTGATPPSSVSPAAPQQLPAGDRRTFEPFLVVLPVLGQAVFVQVVDQIRQQPLPPRSLLVGEQLPRRLHDGISLVVEGGQEPLDVAGTCGLRGGDATGSGAAAGPGHCPTPPPVVTPPTHTHTPRTPAGLTAPPGLSGAQQHQLRLRRQGVEVALGHLRPVFVEAEAAAWQGKLPPGRVRDGADSNPGPAPRTPARTCSNRQPFRNNPRRLPAATPNFCGLPHPRRRKARSGSAMLPPALPPPPPLPRRACAAGGRLGRAGAHARRRARRCHETRRWGRSQVSGARARSLLPLRSAFPLRPWRAFLAVPPPRARLLLRVVLSPRPLEPAP